MKKLFLSVALVTLLLPIKSSCITFPESYSTCAKDLAKNPIAQLAAVGTLGGLSVGLVVEIYKKFKDNKHKISFGNIALSSAAGTTIGTLSGLCSSLYTNKFSVKVSKNLHNLKTKISDRFKNFFSSE